MEKNSISFYLLIIFFLLHSFYSVSSQQQNANWYFGNQAGINFNDETSPPNVLTDNGLTMPNAAASISDESGNLLFYTNGSTIFSADHNLMLNGNIDGDSNSSNVLIASIPYDPDKYYIFTTESSLGNGSGLSYSTVDMSLNNGNGAVTQTTNLLSSSSQKLTITKKSDGDYYWLIAFAPSSNSKRSDTFYSYKVDRFGISLENQYTVPFLVNPTSDPEGQMKISPNNQNIVLIHNTSATFTELENSVYVFDFDETTGEVSNPSSNLGFVGTNKYFGAEFSSDSNLLYISEIQDNKKAVTGKIYQIQYKAPLPFSTIYTVTDNLGANSIYALQRGLNGKIYAVDKDFALGVIDNPNAIGIEVNYNSNGVLIGSEKNTKGLTSQAPPRVGLSILPPKDSNRPVILGNPITDVLKVKFQDIQTYTIEIYNGSSIPLPTSEPIQTVIYEDMKNKKVYQIDVSNLVPDMYYLVIQDEQQNIWYESVIKIED